MRDRLVPIRLLAMDVDGVLTGGAITWAQAAEGGPLLEIKQFDVRDGLGLAVAACGGVTIAWVTGRRSPVVAQRARELGVAELHLGARAKRRVLAEILARRGIEPAEAAYIGDDLNDLPAFDVVGLRVAVADAAPELIRVADLVTQRPGGSGAVREVVERILRAQDRWEAAVKTYLARLEDEASPLQ